MFEKHSSTPETAAWEAAGLRWLASSGTVGVVEVLDVRGPVLGLERLHDAGPTPAAAEDFGRALARLHRCPADGFGAPPAGWQGDGWLGPNDDLLPAPMRTRSSWTEHWTEDCLLPVARVAVSRGHGGRRLLEAVEHAVRVLRRGQHDGSDESPCPVHGDLWSGNIVWTGHGAMVIDPSAHGGHRELDIAMLHLFGAPFLPRIMAGYQAEFPLREGWQQRMPLHQLHHLLVHVACFGGSYLSLTFEALATLDG